jgi:hypothetical protein
MVDAACLQVSVPTIDQKIHRRLVRDWPVRTRPQEVHMRSRIVAAVVGLPALAFATAWASHVKIEVAPQHAPPITRQAPGSTTVVVPSPPTAQVPQSLNAEQIKANVVRADTIYANRIEADEVRGQIHQTSSVKIGDTSGDVTAPEVSAAVIYADEITANAIVAQHVYVRDLRRK